MREYSWIAEKIKTFKSFDTITQGYLIAVALGYLIIISDGCYSTEGFIFFSSLFGLMLVAPFVIKKCIYTLVYTIAKAIDDAKNKQVD